MIVKKGADEQVNSLPPGLVRVMSTPRDIALAIRIRGDTNQAREVSEAEGEGEKMEDLFDEVGMEYMDESSLPEDDDERRMSTPPLLSPFLTQEST
jgi:hypothetical protein